jgi:hypothetical protein
MSGRHRPPSHPLRRRRSQQRSRSKRPQKTAKSQLKTITSLTLDMEVPLNDATDLVHALRLIGSGLLIDHNDDGRPINALAWSALHRLDVLRTRWKAIHKAARRAE